MVPDAAPLSPVARRATLVAASLAFSLVVLEVTVVNVALEDMRRSLGAGVDGLQWIANAYALVFASLLLSAGSISDRIGARRTFVGGLLVFAVASLLCGATETVAVIIAGRALQGVGAALAVPASLSLVSSAFPEPAARARAISVWAGGASLALASGMVFGGLLVDAFGWPSIFLVNVPLCLAIAALVLWLTPPAPQRPTAPLTWDLPGQALAIAALGSLTYACIAAGAHGLFDPTVLGALAATVIAAAAFVRVEHGSRDPMLPPSLFAIRGFTVACVVGFVVNFSYYGLMFFMGLYFQMAAGYTPAETGLAFLPMTAATMAANLFSGALIALYGTRFPIFAGQVLAVIAAAGGLVLLLDDRSYGAIVAPLVAISVGVAIVVPGITVMVLESVGPFSAGVASGALNAARQAGGVIGIGVFGALTGGDAGNLVATLPVAFALVAAAFAVGIGIAFYPSRRLASAGRPS